MPTHPADGPILGTLYGSDAMRAVFDEATYFQRMLDVEAALARVQGRLGIIPSDAAEAIVAAAQMKNLDTEDLAASARNVGYPVVGLVAGLAKAAGKAGGWTHWGATTQDIMDTATVLQVRDGLDLIETELRAILIALVGPGGPAPQHRHGGAHPSAAGVAGDLRPQMRDLGDAIHRASATSGAASCPGAGGRVRRRRRHAGLAWRWRDRGHAGAGGGTRLGTPLAPWHVCRDGLAEAVGFLGLVCGTLAKIATDIILLAQTEVGEVAEPYVAGRGQSSTMPQKRNPIASEYILAATRTVQGLVPVMLGAMAQDHERATGPWQAEALVLPQAFVLTHGALRHTRVIAEGVVVDANRMRANLEHHAWADRVGGGYDGPRAVLGRAEAHHVVKHACDVALAGGIPLADALGRDPAVSARLDQAAVARMLDPANYLGSAQAFIDRVVAAAV